MPTYVQPRQQPVVQQAQAAPKKTTQLQLQVSESTWVDIDRVEASFVGAIRLMQTSPDGSITYLGVRAATAPTAPPVTPLEASESGMVTTKIDEEEHVDRFLLLELD